MKNVFNDSIKYEQHTIILHSNIALMPNKTIPGFTANMINVTQLNVSNQ